MKDWRTNNQREQSENFSYPRICGHNSPFSRLIMIQTLISESPPILTTICHSIHVFFDGSSSGFISKTNTAVVVESPSPVSVSWKKWLVFCVHFSVTFASTIDESQLVKFTFTRQRMIMWTVQSDASSRRMRKKHTNKHTHPSKMIGLKNIIIRITERNKIRSKSLQCTGNHSSVSWSSINGCARWLELCSRDDRENWERRDNGTVAAVYYSGGVSRYKKQCMRMVMRKRKWLW